MADAGKTSGIKRVRAAWAGLASEQRLAALCASGLFVTMFLPWYSRDTTAVVKGRLQNATTTLSAWKAFSFVEAAILLVAIAVLVLVFARGERKAFHLPGGDGMVIFAGGVWVALLVFYRLIDNKTGASSEFQKVDYGVSWGIFVTLLCGAALAYAGQRLGAAHVVEPPLPGEAPTVASPPRSGDDNAPAPPPTRQERQRERERARAAARARETAATTVAPARRPPAEAQADGSERPEIDGGTQLSFDEQE